MNKNNSPKRKILVTSSEGQTDNVVSETDGESGRGCAHCVRGTPMWRYNDASKWMGCNTCAK